VHSVAHSLYRSPVNSSGLCVPLPTHSTRSLVTDYALGQSKSRLLCLNVTDVGCMLHSNHFSKLSESQYPNSNQFSFSKTYKRMEPTHRMDSTGLFSLIRLSVPALTAFFTPHQLSAIDPSCCTLVASRRVASRRVTQDSLLRRTCLILRLSALSLRVPLAT
jgi:hypothetical protein